MIKGKEESSVVATLGVEGILTCSFCNGITTQEFFPQEESLVEFLFLSCLFIFLSLLISVCLLNPRMVLVCSPLVLCLICFLKLLSSLAQEDLSQRDERKFWQSLFFPRQLCQMRR